MITQQDLNVTSLGECRYRSPLCFDSPSHPGKSHFRDRTDRIRYRVKMEESQGAGDAVSFEEAGPREQIFFDPAKTTAAIVTCGGLSPGLNNVIRSIYKSLTENYGVHRVLGIRNGYLGLTQEAGLDPIQLTPELVEPIDKLGGTILGSSRGPREPKQMADFLRDHQIDILFCIGGDGTQRGAHALDQELRRRGTETSIVGIPKTIDNDVPFVGLSFGYATALDKASQVIRAAHVEARGAINGIGLVKLMGRHAGFIAAGASIVSQEVDFTLIPEIEFPMDGENGFLPALETRMRRRGHAVIVVAEGAGQHHSSESSGEHDASGNLLHQDIGAVLNSRIRQYFSKIEFPVTVKYFDPSYFIRSVPATMFDRYLCDQMARQAVHAAMAGKTGMLIGLEHEYYINVPIPAVVSQTKCVDISGQQWRAVLESTGQPRW